ncbi:CopG family transcriptional regulator [Granulosicoccus sp.]|nr:CopG family transcriptional regulator [Granulosicoccus sp.]
MPTQTVAHTNKPADEKITINLSVVDLGQIDLLVQQGFFSNRSDLIRSAIRRELAIHAQTVSSVVEEQMLVLGLRHITAAELQALQKKNKRLSVRVLGLLSIADDVSSSLALSTIESITILGAFHAPPALRKALASRIT